MGGGVRGGERGEVGARLEGGKSRGVRAGGEYEGVELRGVRGGGLSGDGGEGEYVLGGIELGRVYEALGWGTCRGYARGGWVYLRGVLWG